MDLNAALQLFYLPSFSQKSNYLYTSLYNNTIQITQDLQTPAGRVEWFLFFVPMFPKSEFPFSAPYLPPLYIGFLIQAYISNGCFFLFNPIFSGVSDWIIALLCFSKSFNSYIIFSIYKLCLRKLMN